MPKFPQGVRAGLYCVSRDHTGTARKFRIRMPFLSSFCSFRIGLIFCSFFISYSGMQIQSTRSVFTRLCSNSISVVSGYPWESNAARQSSQVSK